jgi:HemK-like putative methylase
VLLKNKNGLLPLRREMKICLIGDIAFDGNGERESRIDECERLLELRGYESLGKERGYALERTRSEDMIAPAVALAKENAVRCGLEGKVRFAVADGLDDFDEPGLIDVIVSNPPYIESAVCGTLDPRVKDWEPRIALDGGPGGLEFYERYLGDALNLLKSGGSVFFEIGESQGEAVSRLMFDYGFEDILIEKDYAGMDRFASARLP